MLVTATINGIGPTTYTAVALEFLIETALVYGSHVTLDITSVER